MGARKDEEADFISGIYNYCDRWCERCPMTSHCFLFYRESIRRTEHKANNEDPDDLTIALQDLKGEFQNTIEICQEVLEREQAQPQDEMKGNDQEKNEPDLEEIDISQHPLHVKSHKFAMDTHRFLDPFCSLIHEEERKGIPTEQLNAMQNCFEVLSWYHMQIAVKIDRALSGAIRANDKEISEAMEDDFNGSAKVAYIGLLNSLEALTKVYEWNQSWQADIMPLLTDIYELIEGLNQEFPGYVAFKRPGFDD